MNVQAPLLVVVFVVFFVSFFLALLRRRLSVSLLLWDPCCVDSVRACVRACVLASLARLSFAYTLQIPGC